MNYNFSDRSKANLAECHKDLQIIASTAIKFIDFAVIEGHRPKKEQDEAYEKKFSKVKWPNSKHNQHPSMAFDVIPYVNQRFVGWNDKEAFIFLAGHFIAISKMLLQEGKISHIIRWGGDFNRNNDLKDQSFIDLPHYELI